jgi:CHAT domain-containing protein
MGLAQAFLVRGTMDVVAPTRVVDDRDARRLVQRFYNNFATTQEVSVALARSQHALSKESASEDWFAFRHLSR